MRVDLSFLDATILLSGRLSGKHAHGCRPTARAFMLLPPCRKARHRTILSPERENIMTRRALAVLVAALLAAPAALIAQSPQGRPAAATTEKGPAAEPTPARYDSHHSIRIGTQTVEYDARVGSIILRDDDEKPIGELYYTSYTKSGVTDRSHRPIMFSYNGGPGSSSFWLHMGIMGPRRVSVPGTEHSDPAPYKIVDNPYTLLDKTDIVMVDPIGTGFSHPLGDTPGKEFWGVDEDARSITQFIRRYLSQNNRWNSPKYLLGESYGTTRSAVLSAMLQGANIDLNGVILLSTVLDFRTISFAPGDDLPYEVNLPSYAAVAWYHKALPDQPAQLEPFLREVEHFAVNEYATALLQGGALTAAERSKIIDKVHGYTGLSKEYIDRADLRVSAPGFEKELLRSKQEVVGRLDARYLGASGDLLAPYPDQDPQSSAISAAYAGAWNTYLRTELGYDGTREYVPSGNVQPWNWNRRGGGSFFGNSTPNVSGDLARALQTNPKLQVLLLTGLYDLATPYFAAAWTMDHMGLTPDLREDIQRVDFESGHMVYVNEDVLPKWKETLDAFIDRTSGGGM
jgi:carboxypeptidase C (cathepsin A)